MRVKVAILLGDPDITWAHGDIRKLLYEDEFCCKHLEHPVVQVRSVEEAAEFLSANQKRLLITIGISDGVVDSLKAAGGHASIIAYATATMALMAAIPLNGVPQTFDPTKFGPPVVAAVRKRTSKLLMSKMVDFRVLSSKSELQEYAALRFRVWTEKNYLRATEASQLKGLEIDWADNLAIPVGAFSRPGESAGASEQKLIGCARLITGVTQQRWQSVFSEIVEERGTKALRKKFQLPEGLENPYDMLDSFEGFTDYYHHIKRNEINEAELSRVIVAPEERRRGVGEALVDFAVEQARRLSVDILFLACRPEHASFYRRSGFKPIDGMTCDSFARVRVPSIAMDQQLTPQRALTELEVHS